MNLKDWTQGNIDTALTPKGRRQATALAKLLPQEVPRVDALYASTMKRAVETAQTIAAAYACEMQPDDRLREIGNNRHDHSPYPNDALPGDYADYRASQQPFASVTPATDGGESLMHFRTRVGHFIEETIARHHGETVVAVCHGGVVECAFDHIFNIGPWRRCEVWDFNTGVTHFEYVELPGRETWRLHYHNRINHLADFTDEQQRRGPGYADPNGRVDPGANRAAAALPSLLGQTDPIDCRGVYAQTPGRSRPMARCETVRCKLTAVWLLKGNSICVDACRSKYDDTHAVGGRAGIDVRPDIGDLRIVVIDCIGDCLFAPRLDQRNGATTKACPC